jgi:hypothetical protein
LCSSCGCATLSPREHSSLSRSGGEVVGRELRRGKWVSLYRDSCSPVRQDPSSFPDRRGGAHARPKAAARARSAAPGTRKAAQNPNAEESRPPPIGPSAKPIEVADEATPKAAPCRAGDAASFMARLAAGMAQPTNTPVARRNAQSSGTLVTRAWGIAASPASAREAVITRRVPNLLASLPPSNEPRDATRAAVPMIWPGWRPGLQHPPGYG